MIRWARIFLRRLFATTMLLTVAVLIGGGCGDERTGAQSQSATSAALTGSRTAGGWGTKNLSTEGTLDWAHWGLTNINSFNHKSGVTPSISNFTRLGTSSTLRLNCCADGFSWTGGTPTASASNVIGGVYVDTPNVSGDGFQITVAADTTTRTLKLYTGYWCARAKLQAMLSDGSAPAYIDTSADLTNAADTSVYAIDFAAATAGQTLTVSYTIDLNHCTSGDTGEVWLLAATLTGPSVCTPTTCAAQGKNCGTLSDGCGGSLDCGDCTAPQTCGGGGTPNVCGSSSGSGDLAGSRTAGGWSAKNLSTEGTTDWAHWGLTGVGSFNHKAGITQQISNFTRLGGGSMVWLNCCAGTFSWTGGTPTTSASNVIGGVYIDTPNASGDGFRITVPADTSPKTLKLYTGYWCVRAKLQATLSDGSAPAFVDTSADLTNAAATSVYTLDFNAAASGQTLTVDYTVDLNHCTTGDLGEVWLLAATLAGPSGCTPTTCAAQGKNCGTISDGCGGSLDCGDCTAPQTCGGGGTPNVCGGACTPTTCAAQGKNCDTISDGCGGSLDCGDCTAPQTCGGGGTPNVCGPGLVTLASGQNPTSSPGGLAADQANVYWTNADGTVMRVSKSGGAPVQLASGQSGAANLAVDGTSVYWTNTSAGTVMRCAAVGCGGTPTQLTSGQASPLSVVVDSTSLYWVNSVDLGPVMKMPVGGGTVTTLASSETTPKAIALDSMNVYWAMNGRRTQTIMKVPIGGGTPATVVALKGFLPTSAIAVDSASVYYQRAATPTPSGAVWKVPIGGGSPTQLGSQPGSARGITVDATNVYWTLGSAQGSFGNVTFPIAGSVQKVPLGGGTRTELATGGSPASITVDASYVYWTDSTSGTVMRLDK